MAVHDEIYFCINGRAVSDMVNVLLMLEFWSMTLCWGEAVQTGRTTADSL